LYPGLPKTSKEFDYYCHIILTIVPILLTLTVEGPSDDSCIAFDAPGKNRKVQKTGLFLQA
jgi:hypothetical protein